MGGDDMIIEAGNWCGKRFPTYINSDSEGNYRFQNGKPHLVGLWRLCTNQGIQLLESIFLVPHLTQYRGAKRSYPLFRTILVLVD
jgi:hypothetical protein